MNITGSPDISVLQVQVTFDISGTNPMISLVNLSQGDNLGNVSWAFTAQSPAGSFIAQGDINDPDVTGDWTDFVISNPWPKPMGNIEWSGAPYSFFVTAKDSNGNVYTSVAQNATICRPYGNLPTSKTPYGLAKTYIQVKCDSARIFFEDITPSSYKGNAGTKVSSILRVIYPLDPTNTIPPPFQITNFSSALVPITYSSNNYQFSTSIVYDYDLGNFTFVRIKYYNLDRFAVACDIDLCPLVCEIAKLTKQIESGNCVDIAGASEKLKLINSKMLLVFIGKMEPLCGIDIAALIEEIKVIGGFDCNCCNAPTGIIPTTASVVDGFTFEVVHIGGDVDGDVTTVGPNVQINLHDVSYIFKICDGSPSGVDAFEVIPSVSSDGFTKTYCLNIDGPQLAEDILTIIGGSASLINIFNSLVNTGFGDADLIVDGACIFQSSSTYDYTFLLNSIPLDTTFAILNSVQVNNVSTPLNFQFNQTNLPALQTYLNALGIGTFVVNDLGSGNVQIDSTANPANIQSLTYKIGVTTQLATMTKTASGFIAKTANEVVQSIIDYLCGITDAQVATSQDYEICYVDPADGVKKISTVTTGVALSTFINELLARGCNTIDYVISLSAVNCSNIRETFPLSTNEIQAADIVLGTKTGTCAQLGIVELGQAILELGSFNQDFVNAFCALVAQCGAGQLCEPYTLFQVSTSLFNNDCPDVTGFGFSFSGQTLSVNTVTFGNTPPANQTVTVEYKLTSDTSYTLLDAAVTVQPNGTVSVPPTVTLLAGQPYDVRVTNNCSSPVVSVVQVINVPGNPQNVKLTSGVPLPASMVTLTGIAGYTLPGGGLSQGQTLFGIHTAFTGIISFTISGTPPIASSYALVKNGVQIDCVNVAAPGSFAFSSQTFGANDALEINGHANSC